MDTLPFALLVLHFIDVAPFPACILPLEKSEKRGFLFFFFKCMCSLELPWGCLWKVIFLYICVYLEF